MSNFNSEVSEQNILSFAKKWKNVLITTIVMAVICAIVFSLLIEDKYESSVVFFPSTTSSVSRAVLNNENYKEKDYLEFGEEEEAEQLIQILQSDDIREYIIKKFDLMNHYKINSDNKYRKTKLNKMYESNIDFYRTKFMSVKIEVLDTDPHVAANIANEIALMLDSVKNRMLKKVAIQAFEIVKNEYNTLVSEINAMEDTLNELRLKGVQDYETQVEVLSNQYGAALVSNNYKAAERISSRLDTLSKYGGKYLSLSQQLEYEREKLSDLRAVYAEARVNAQAKLNHKFIVNSAHPAERPVYPVRWLIVAVASIST